MKIYSTHSKPPSLRRRQRESEAGRYQRLLYKYTHQGCPAAHMEDNCAHPDRCAENGRCLDLGPNPFDKES